MFSDNLNENFPKYASYVHHLHKQALGLNYANTEIKNCSAWVKIWRIQPLKDWKYIRYNILC